ncbi:MAG: ATP-binding protein [Desulfovibrio sp.]|nr:ATP-binding protein [Desulfovibrio sp.]
MAEVQEIVVISGKGGTGKTSITAAFAACAKETIVCDLDVDVPDLYIVLHPSVQKEEVFMGGNKAVIQPNLCVGCGNCASLCRFGAVCSDDGRYTIDPIACEGCGVCYKLCPEQAIVFPEVECGVSYVSTTRFGYLIHAKLHPGEENSGKLVSLLKQKARALAKQKGLCRILCDGSPGIGCPVVSSLSGASVVLAVVEPSVSGWHDFERVAKLCDHFRIPCMVLINRWDLNPEGSRLIEERLKDTHYIYLGKLAFSSEIISSMNEGICVTEYSTPLSDQIRDFWEKIINFVPKRKSASLSHFS